MIARRVVLAGAVVLCLAAVGCSSKAASTTSSGATSATTPAQTTKLTVGTSPTISNASLYLATEDGTFAKNNLDVTPVVIQSGAQAIPQLLNGQIQFAAADPLSSILTISKNVPLEIVVGGLATSMAGVPQVVYLTSKSYASSHPDVVKAFAASINAADTTLGQNPGLIRTVGAKSTTINAATLAKITLPYFGPKLSLDSLTKLETLMVKYGVLSAPVQNLGQSIYGGS